MPKLPMSLGEFIHRNDDWYLIKSKDYKYKNPASNIIVHELSDNDDDNEINTSNNDSNNNQFILEFNVELIKTYMTMNNNKKAFDLCKSLMDNQYANNKAIKALYLITSIQSNNMDTATKISKSLHLSENKENTNLTNTIPTPNFDDYKKQAFSYELNFEAIKERKRLLNKKRRERKANKAKETPNNDSKKPGNNNTKSKKKNKKYTGAQGGDADQDSDKFRVYSRNDPRGKKHQSKVKIPNHLKSRKKKT
mmetsp:Transcript_53813/g.65961  ORF Transcript_53813/g.65961 Transcript_53813/m.65961 type:complete len:251 (-) Transcript_53813:22-774(-)